MSSLPVISHVPIFSFALSLALSPSPSFPLFCPFAPLCLRVCVCMCLAFCTPSSCLSPILLVLTLAVGARSRCRSQVKRHIFNVAISAYAQLHWRFSMPFEDWPYELIRVLVQNPSGLAEAVHKFWETPTCCLEPKLALKMRSTFKTESDLLNSQSFWRALRLFARHTKIANMHLERLLASIKRSVCTKVPTLERVSSNGFLLEVLGMHTSAGGLDPRTDMAEDLIADGVPVVGSFQGKKSAAKQAQPAPGWMLYANDRIANSDSQDMSSGDMQALRARSKREFLLLPEGARQQWEDRAAFAAAARMLSMRGEDESGCSTKPTARDASGKAVVGLNSNDLPVNPDAFRAAAGVVDSGASFYSWGKKARERLQKRCFVFDRGAILPRARVALPKCCSHQHFGLCKSKDSDHIRVYLKCGAVLWQFLWSNVTAGTWVRVYIATRAQVDRAVPAFRDLTLCVAYLRGADPRLILLLEGKGF